LRVNCALLCALKCKERKFGISANLDAYDREMTFYCRIGLGSDFV
jgi:hypothetical protein